MNKIKVIKVESEQITFENGIRLYSDHETSCCESHYLSFKDLTIDDFDGLKFNLTNDKFFSKIDGYGIALNPIKGHPIRVPGYGHNNGYYSTELMLCISGEGINKKWDITECQEIEG